MISITIKIEEKMGTVQVSMVSPQSPNATAQETIQAGLMCKGIRETLAAITKARGERQPHDGPVHRAVPEVRKDSPETK
jgi:hypothetical protein